MSQYKLYIFDLDGTIYRGTHVIPHAAETIRELISQGALVRYLTNNSAADPDEVSAKLNAMGVASEPSWVYGSGPAAAKLCLRYGYKRAFIVGETQLKSAFEKHGVASVTESPDVVVSGICRGFTYDLMNQAMQCIRGGCPYIATNLDPSYPKEHGVFEPGSGSIVAAISTCSGVTPELAGKPQPGMVLDILDELGIAKHQALVVGDREDTDLDCGRNAGVDTWLVLTGVEKEMLPNQPGSPDLRGLL